MRGHLTPALGQSPSLGPCNVPALESPRASLKGARPRQLPALGTPLRASEGESIGRVPAWVILLPGAFGWPHPAWSRCSVAVPMARHAPVPGAPLGLSSEDLLARCSPPSGFTKAAVGDTSRFPK